MATALGLVFLSGLITALATGLGALPFAFVGAVSDRGVAIANSIAAGLMLGASLGLMLESTEFGTPQAIVGAGLLTGSASIDGNQERKYG